MDASPRLPIRKKVILHPLQSITLTTRASFTQTQDDPGQEFLQIDIKSISYQKDELVSTYVQDRHIIMDVACTLTDGRQIVIEMQKRTPDDLKNRLFYYGSALIYTQLKRGDDWFYYFRNMKIFLH